MKPILLYSSLLLAFCSRLVAQTETTRQPIDEASYGHVVDRYGYDRTLALEAVTLGAWKGRTPYTIEKIQYRSTHDQRVPGYFAYPQDAAARPCPAVLLVHGWNGFWGKGEGWVLEWMDILVRSGRCVLAVDNYGFGERFKGDQDWVGARSVGHYESIDNNVQSIVDLRRGLDYLFERVEVDTAKVAVMGASYGGQLATVVAALEPDRVAAAALTVTWTNYGDPNESPYDHLLNFVHRIKIPVIMVNASADETLRDPKYVEEMHDALQGPKELVWYDQGHYLPPFETNKEIMAWMDRYLR